MNEDFMQIDARDLTDRRMVSGPARHLMILLGAAACVLAPFDAMAMRRAIGTPVAPNPDCGIAKRDAGSTGAVLGAIGGGVAGKALAATAVQPEGVALGVVLGAFFGSAIGSSQVTCVSPAPQADYAPPAPGPAWQVPMTARRIAGGDWYQPSPHSYYGRERRGPLISAPAPISRPAQVPRDSYVGYAYPVQPMMAQPGKPPVYAIPVQPGMPPVMAPMIPQPGPPAPSPRS